ncbi:MAG: FkbM family methyltransferase [Hyphomicrobiaceae bacterium]
MPNRLTEKARLYGAEVAFSLDAPRGLPAKLRLLGEAARFHLRNALACKPDPSATNRRAAFDLDLGAYSADIELRPQAGDLAVLFEVLARQAYRIDDDVLPPDSVAAVIDAGANIGFSALYFASRYPNARIFSIEPNPGNFDLLVRNTRTEPRIVAINAALTGEAMPRVIVSNHGPAWNYTTSVSRCGDAGGGVAVRGITVAELMAENELPRVDLFKIDIEGFERHVFAEGAFLLQVGVIVAELHGDYDLAAFNRDLAASGHRAALHPQARDPAVVLATRAQVGTPTPT